MEVILRLQPDRSRPASKDKLIDAITDAVESKGYYVENYELLNTRTT